eukprot:TRINITY_DN55650_c0_g1_i1.p1 TRINITY_DN55650_c0_g1~~TRINITY_DN55650_c0_g1_i1.p1  ORF type:complete len:188 (-),score=31.95 TRINITY_DN55650_c0_g1_i1:443-1006(-)
MDSLCKKEVTAHLITDLCKDYLKNKPKPAPRKVHPPPPPPPPPCKKVGEKCYKDDYCCEHLKCRSDAKDKKDQVCYKPCVPLGEECGKKDDCCDKKADCVEKETEDCYYDKKGKKICKTITMHVCERPPCVPEYDDCSGGKYCCKGLECVPIEICKDVHCSPYDKKKGKCPPPDCTTFYQCEKPKKW